MLRFGLLLGSVGMMVSTGCTPKLDHLSRTDSFSAAALQSGGVVVLPSSVNTEALTAEEAGQAPVQLLSVLGDRWPGIPANDLSMAGEEELVANAVEGFNAGAFPTLDGAQMLGERGKGQYVLFTRIDGVEYSRYEGEDTEDDKSYTTYNSVCSVSGAMSILDTSTGEVIWEARHTASVEETKRYQSGGMDVIDALVTVTKVAIDKANDELGYPDPPPVLTGVYRLFDVFLLNWKD